MTSYSEILKNNGACHLVLLRETWICKNLETFHPGEFKQHQNCRGFHICRTYVTVRSYDICGSSILVKEKTTYLTDSGASPPAIDKRGSGS